MLLPHLADRALTVKRYPNGVDEKFFFEKNAARGTPDWVRTVTLPVPGSTMNRETIDFVVVEELADPGLAGQPRRARAARAAVAHPAARPQAAHRPAGVRPRPGRAGDDRRVLRGRACCCATLLAEDGLTLFAKTSGSKGMQVSAPIAVDDPELPSQYAHAVAQAARARRTRSSSSRG